MAKIKIVNSKHVGSGCWSPERFIGNCKNCKGSSWNARKLKNCKYPEAKIGRKLLAEEQLEKIKKENKDRIIKAEKELNQATSESEGVEIPDYTK